MLKPGSCLAGYEIVGVLGMGQAAVTYRARRISDRREVALKVPHAASLADRTFVSRFLREAELGKRLLHRGIVQVYEAGKAGDELFIAMELVEGTTLAFELTGRNPLPLVRALNWAREIADALAHAQESGVVHRNLKPNHIMLVPGGRVKVMDLGVARAYGEVGLTLPGVFLGAPTYSAPEADNPRALDHRSDLYALGVILYEMLEGQPPFEAASPIEVMLMHKEKPFPTFEELRAPMPRKVWELVERLCRKDPSERPQTAAAVVEQLDRLLELASVAEL